MRDWNPREDGTRATDCRPEFRGTHAYTCWPVGIRRFVLLREYEDQRLTIAIAYPRESRIA